MYGRLRVRGVLAAQSTSLMVDVRCLPLRLILLKAGGPVAEHELLSGVTGATTEYPSLRATELVPLPWVRPTQSGSEVRGEATAPRRVNGLGCYLWSTLIESPARLAVRQRITVP